MLGKDEILKVFTAFSGYDSQCMALDRIGVNYELVGWSEIDSAAITAHNAVYPQWADRNMGDISKINWGGVPDFQLFTYSSPCQDFSNAGRMAGGEEGSGTRSSLLWECRKAILAKRPKYLLMENVKNLVSAAFLPTFLRWMRELEGYGYTNHYKILNAKDYGVPQNRERIFVVSIRDEVGCYYFPEPIPLSRRIRDIVEEDVDERYFLSPSQIAGIIEHCDRKMAEGCGFKPQFRGGGADKHRNHNSLRSKTNGYIFPSSFRYGKSQTKTIVDADGVSPCINGGGHDGIAKLMIKPDEGNPQD